MAIATIPAKTTEFGQSARPAQTTGSARQNRQLFSRYMVNIARTLYAQVADVAFLTEATRAQVLHILPTALEMLDAAGDEHGENSHANPASDGDLWPAVRQLLLAVAPKMEQAGLRDEWLPFVQWGVNLSYQQQDIAAEAALQLQLGLLHQWSSRWDEAVFSLQRSADCYAQMTDQANLGYAMSRLGYLLRTQGKIAEAEETVRSALPLLPADDIRREFVLFVLGVVAQDRQHWSEAEAYLQQSLQLCQEIGDDRMIAKRMRDLGLILREQGKLRPARMNYVQAIDLFTAVDDPIEKAVTQLNLGSIYSALGQYTHALDCFANATESFQQVHDYRHLAFTYNNQGNVYRKLQRWAQAEQALRSSIDILVTLAQPYEYINVMENLGHVYLESAQREKARTTFQQALQLVAEIPEHPRYQQLSQMIEEHLMQSQAE